VETKWLFLVGINGGKQELMNIIKKYLPRGKAEMYDNKIEFRQVCADTKIPFDTMSKTNRTMDEAWLVFFLISSVLCVPFCWIER
jgi:hypothetical protein